MITLYNMLVGYWTEPDIQKILQNTGPILKNFGIVYMKKQENVNDAHVITFTVAYIQVK